MWNLLFPKGKATLQPSANSPTINHGFFYQGKAGFKKKGKIQGTGRVQGDSLK
jgi:hypothetical protein